MVLRTIKRPYLTGLIIQTDNNSRWAEEDVLSCLLTTNWISHETSDWFKKKKYLLNIYKILQEKWVVSRRVLSVVLGLFQIIFIFIMTLTMTR